MHLVFESVKLTLDARRVERRRLDVDSIKLLGRVAKKIPKHSIQPFVECSEGVHAPSPSNLDGGS